MENNIDEIKVSKHAIERYVERIEGVTDKVTKNSRITLNFDEIEKRIKKLYQYSTKLFTGQIGEKNNTKSYFIKDNIGLIVSTDNTIITLYKFDFGLPVNSNQIAIDDVKGTITQIIKKIELRKISISQKEETTEDTNKLIDMEIEELKNKISVLEEQKKINSSSLKKEHKELKVLNSELSKYTTMLFSKKF